MNAYIGKVGSLENLSSQLLARSPHTYLKPEVRDSKVGGSGCAGCRGGKSAELPFPPIHTHTHAHTRVQAHSHTHYTHAIQLTA